MLLIFHKSRFFILGILLFTPLFIGICGYIFLTNQKSDLWYSLMPDALFAYPQFGKNFIILTRKNSGSFPSYLLYPNNSQLWIVLGEYITISPNTYGGLGEFTIVDENGDFFYTDCRSQGSIGCLENFNGTLKLPVKNVTQETLTSLSRLLPNSFILAEDEELLAIMKKRIPLLQNRTDILLFQDAFKAPDNKIFLSSLNPIVVLHIAAFTGFIISGIFLLRTLYKFKSKENLSLICIGELILFLLPIPFVLVFGGIHKLIFRWYLYFLWIGTSISVWLFSTRKSAQDRYKLIEIKNIHFMEYVIPVIAVLVITWSVFPDFLTAYITHGDAQRYVQGGMFVYDYGKWPLQEIRDYKGKASLLADYPPGPSILMATTMWLSSVNKEKMFFPGIQTGSTTFIYALSIFFVHSLFILALIFFVKSIASQERILWVLALVLTVVYIPSIKGTLYAAESFTWPIFGSILICFFIWKHTRNIYSFYEGLLLSGILLLLKNESMVLFISLIIPAIIWCFPKSQKFSNKEKIGSILIFIISISPFLFWLFQKRIVGISSGVYNFSSFVMHDNLTLYVKLLHKAYEMSKQNYSYVFILLMFLFGIQSYLRDHDFRKILIPIGILIYIFSMIATYLFSTEPSIETHFLVSWDRLSVYPLILTLFYLLDLFVIASDKPDHHLLT